MRIARTISILLAVLGGLFTLGMMVYSGRGWEQGADWWAGFAGLGLWNLIPYAGLIGCALLARRTKLQGVTVLIGAILVVGLSIALLVDGFLIHPDAQNALLFLVLPGCQVVAVVVLIAITLALGMARGATHKENENA